MRTPEVQSGYWVLLVISLLAGMVAGIWRRGWIAAPVWAAVVALAVLAEVRSEGDMSGWLVLAAGASAFFLTRTGFAVVRYFGDRSRLVGFQ